MRSTIWITPMNNIKNAVVVDESKIEKREYDTKMDILTFFDVRHEETRKDNLMNVSVYDDVIVEDEIQYAILRMLSK